jgi:hypothetical protein
MSKSTFRWKRNPRPTGLARIGAGHPGHTLRKDGIEYAFVNAHSFRHSRKQGWYWVAPSRDKIPHCNTCAQELTEQEAKDAALAYIKKHLAKAKGEA